MENDCWWTPKINRFFTLGFKSNIGNSGLKHPSSHLWIGWWKSQFEALVTLLSPIKYDFVEAFVVWFACFKKWENFCLECVWIWVFFFFFFFFFLWFNFLDLLWCSEMYILLIFPQALFTWFQGKLRKTYNFFYFNKTCFVLEGIPDHPLKVRL